MGSPTRFKARGRKSDPDYVRFYARDGLLLRRLSCAAIAAATVVSVAAGCAGGGSGGHVAGRLIRVTERDFKISAPKRVATGDLTLSVLNRGPDAHELIIVRSRRGELPLRTDGLTVNEEGLEHATVGVLEPGGPHSLRRLRLHLPPGSYELICNMSGHYLGGMHARLIVE
jgi:uncharacterized cupredoxin-like copper-binding protein